MPGTHVGVDTHSGVSALVLYYCLPVSVTIQLVTSSFANYQGSLFHHIGTKFSVFHTVSIPKAGELSPCNFLLCFPNEIEFLMCFIGYLHIFSEHTSIHIFSVFSGFFFSALLIQQTLCQFSHFSFNTMFIR